MSHDTEPDIAAIAAIPSLTLSPKVVPTVVPTVLVSIRGGVIEDIVATIPIATIIVDYDDDMYDEGHEGRVLSPDGDECIVMRSSSEADPRELSRWDGKP